MKKEYTNDYLKGYEHGFKVGFYDCKKQMIGLVNDVMNKKI